MNKFNLLLFFLFLCTSIKANNLKNAPERKGGTIKGTVLDDSQGTPVEYATVSVYLMRDSSLIDGTITNAKGGFQIGKLKPGKYYVEVSFIGYNKLAVKNIPISPKKRVADLKEVKLRQSTESLDEVSVIAERAPVKYQIDKKVIPVSKQITAASGTAVDVLENVPSVSVDIEGNVSLRGSSNFTVLVDGKPSILDASDILEQMPASMIENIEIITNPSAKYDPEGTAGIINVITKKNKARGMTGVSNVNLGTLDNYGADILMTYRKKKWNFNLGLDYNQRRFEGDSETENRTINKDTTYYVLSDGKSKMKRDGYGFKLGADFDLNPKNLFSLSFRMGKRDMSRGSNLNYEKYAIKDGLRESSVYNDSRNQWKKEIVFINSNFSYTKKFKGKGHQLATSVSYSRRTGGDEESTNELYQPDGTIESGQISLEDGPARKWEMRADYTLPLGGKSKFELGYQGRMRYSESETDRKDYVAGQAYVLNPKYSHDISYDQNVHGLYTTYANKIGIVGYQLGFRTEYTDRLIKYKTKDDQFSINRWDFFPTIHTQIDLGGKNELMASYTRRIQRPRGWYLEPFLTWSDAYNVRQGNPSLDPEYIDSYELGYLRRFGDQAVSIEAYYKVTKNKIERVKTVYQDNVMLSTMENVGKDYSLGLEATLNLNFARWFKNDLIGNIYHYKEEGDFTISEENDDNKKLSTMDFSTESFNWSLRNNSTIILNKSTRLQLSLYYNSPTDWAQGKREGFVMTSGALRKDFFKRKLSATLQVRDILGTAKHEMTSEGQNFYNFSKFDRQPMVRLRLSYKINNYKMKRGRRSENGVDVEEFEM
jgi:outer membrane cobalamin receptor